jgi:hypothetical protein
MTPPIGGKEVSFKELHWALKQFALLIISLLGIAIGLYDIPMGLLSDNFSFTPIIQGVISVFIGLLAINVFMYRHKKYYHKEKSSD